MRTATVGWMVAAVMFVGLGAGWAADGDETIVTVQVSSADHEAEEGYFALGSDVTVMAKPGTDLHRFLSRQRGKKVKIVLTESADRQLSRLAR